MSPDETPTRPEYLPLLEPIEPVPPLEPLRRRREPFWGYPDLFMVLGLLFAAIVVMGLGAIAITLIWRSVSLTSPAMAFGSNLVIYLALLLIFKFVFQLRYGQPFLRPLGWRMTDAAKVGYAAVCGLALPFVISGIGYVLRMPKVETQMDEMMKSMPIAVLVPMAVILAPFFEELFFRGFLQPLLTRTFGLVLGIVITGALFGALHAAEYSFIWQYIVAIGLVGVALGAMRAWTNSIVTSTVMHACFNGLQVVALVVSKHPK
ncbi:MAG TPA: type II CAAX endopeptidase family protein [Bryobacteraceae bacterium]|nr:type II CAAX endopeptidase family protein [Bryobacteraceae bacterium]